MEQGNYVELIDENGRPVRFSVILDFHVNGQEYAVLSEVDQEETGLLFRVREEEGDETPYFEEVTDDAEFKNVSKVYEKIMSESKDDADG